MTQYNELIKRKAKELEAEEWGNQVKYIHASNGIMEIAYNNGLKRFEECKPDGKKWTEGHRESKDSLFQSFGKWIADQRGK
tara:strand:- start:148 stop:390 length:243 start_codon:yes stop_codon:yes gene_type:complete